MLFAAAGSELPTRVDWPESGTPVSDTEALHLHGSRHIGPIHASSEWVRSTPTHKSAAGSHPRTRWPKR
ncbi:MAG: hypothetical protein ACXVQR_07445, partial [Solirubrobacteraceae bacterium]